MSFSSNLREILDLRDIQIKELSAKTGISKNTIDNYLSGQKSLPNAENAVKIAKVLDVSVEFLVNGVNTITQQPLPQNPKYKKLFELIYKLDETDLSSVIALVNSMQKRYKTDTSKGL